MWESGHHLPISATIGLRDETHRLGLGAGEDAVGRHESMKRRALLGVFGLLLAVLLAPAGCALQPQVSIGGTVLGDSQNGDPAGALTPVAASVTCNGTKTKADADGRYHLTVDKAARYVCTAASPPAYAAQSVTVAGGTGASIHLDFGATAGSSACRLDPLSAAMSCGGLHLQPGTLKGKVTFANSITPVANVTVQCPDLAHFGPADLNVPWLTAKTDATGAFSLPGLAAGSYNCIARSDHDDMTAQHVSVQPGAVVQATFALCESRCPPVKYHNGDVMHRYSAYLIFWQPSGVTFEPSGSDKRYISLLQRYISDVGGTSFYGLLTQYFDYRDFVQNSATLGGTWVDSAPYQHCNVELTSCSPAAATQSDPLVDDDLHAEILRALKANPSWKVGPENEFIVFTGFGAEECFNDAPGADCTYKISHGFCGYHSSFRSDLTLHTAAEAIYAYIPDPANDGGLCTFPSGFASPNGDRVADSAINVVSHEQFESISDPLPDDAPGWIDDAAERSREGGEIADKCVRDFANVGPDGATVTLAHGHRYLLQGEWSNAKNGCSFS